MKIQGIPELGQSRKLMKQPPLPRKVPDPDAVWSQRELRFPKGKTILRNTYGDWAEITR